MYADRLVSSSSSIKVPASDPNVNVGYDGSLVPRKKTTNEIEEPHLDVESHIVSSQSSSGKSVGERDTSTTSNTERKMLLSLILYGLSGFFILHDAVPYPVSIRDVLTSIYGALFIYLVVLLFAIMLGNRHAVPTLY